MTEKVHSIKELKHYINKLVVPQLSPKTVVLLTGEMGVGKTQIVKEFCKQFECDSQVSSPTFSIIQEYESTLGIIYHIDLYRIESSEELENTGFWEIFDSLSSSNNLSSNAPKSIIFIEWPQRMDTLRIPKNWKIIKIKYEFLEDGSRELTIR